VTESNLELFKILWLQGKICSREDFFIIFDIIDIRFVYPIVFS
jgi:hypothetical protein